MRRAVWLGCFLGVALVVSVSETQSKTIKLHCKMGEVNSLDDLSAKIIVNDQERSVIVKSRAVTKELELKQTWEYKDGEFAESLKSESVTAKDPRRQNEFAADSKRKVRAPVHQHVLIQDKRIQFGAGSGLNTIDMGAGGAYSSHKGLKGFCDYAD